LSGAVERSSARTDGCWSGSTTSSRRLAGRKVRDIMRRGAAVGTMVAGAVVAGVVARRPLKAHLAEGTLPGRAGSWVNSYLGRPMYRLIADVLELRRDDELLDVACGWGEYLVVHAAQARRVAGIDWSEAKVRLARERLADRIAAGTAEVVHGDATVLPWAEATFSAVTLMDAFPFLADPRRVLSEILRVLRPGGRLVVQIGMRWPNGPPEHLPHPMTQVVDVSDEDAVRGLIEDAGFGEVSIVYGPGSTGPIGRRVDLLLAGSDELRVVKALKPDQAGGR
jgi:SAM-dependent methyltransferase